MAVRPLTSLCAALLALLALAALPTVSAAAETPTASTAQVVDDEILDETFDEDFEEDETADDFDEEDCSAGWVDEEVPFDESLDEEEFGDEELRSTSRQVDEDVLGPDDEELEDDFEDEDLGEDYDDLSDEELCELIEDGVATARIVKVDASKLTKTGVLTAKLIVSGKARINGSLTMGSAGGKASAAKLRVLGTKRLTVAKAGRATLRLRLNRQGRRILRDAKKALRLTFNARVKLASGETIKRSKTLTVKPGKKKPSKGKRT